MTRLSYIAERLFDGERLHEGAALIVEDGQVVAIGAPEGERIDLGDGVLAPGMVDLQVNGAGGVAVNGDLTATRIGTICATLGRLGATACLPTLITDTPEATRAVIAAGIDAARDAVPGFLGLHLEGPHLDPRRKGAHDPALIRQMTEDDVADYCDAARALPALMITLAPAAARPDQIARLHRAGVIVSLGHADCTADEALRAQQAGARAVTHLFNAMSQMGSRTPGLVGAALAGDLSCGIIADGVHVDPVTLRAALAARRHGMFLVSDCMEIAGTGTTELTLGDRRILRREGRLTLPDGTLAGADLTLPRAVGVLVGQVGIAPDRALAMATAEPARLIGAAGRAGALRPKMAADMVHLRPDWSPNRVWRAGRELDQ